MTMKQRRANCGYRVAPGRGSGTCHDCMFARDSRVFESQPERWFCDLFEMRVGRLCVCEQFKFLGAGSI